MTKKAAKKNSILRSKIMNDALLNTNNSPLPLIERMEEAVKNAKSINYSAKNEI